MNNLTFIIEQLRTAHEEFSADLDRLERKDYEQHRLELQQRNARAITCYYQWPSTKPFNPGRQARKIRGESK
jgi:hypothetical protein